jgi:predicted ferric reductase
MKKKDLGNIIIVALIFFNVLFWLIFRPPNDGREHFTNQWIGEIFSSSALLLMSVNIFLSTRARFLEPFFGGLDQMYQSHKKSAIFAYAFILTHFFIMSISGGFHWSISLGKIALIGISVWVLLALAPRIPFIGGDIRLPYHVWKFSHKFIGLFFLVAVLHLLRLDTLLKTTSVTRFYVLPIVYAAIIVYLYKELLQDRLKKKYAYVVAQARKLNGTTLELTLKAQKEKLTYKSGQFLFIGFSGDKKLTESHPFTISSSPRVEEIKLAVKASGDFTQYMQAHLQAGMEAHVEGGYGMFDYTTGSREQLWIAGGIGLTPFLSWIRDFGSEKSFSIDFFYSVRGPEEILYQDEIMRAAEENQNFKPHIISTNLEGRLTAEKIIAVSGPVAGKDIFICGPYPMTLALKSGLIAAGAAARQIHYEEFNFR